MGIINRGITKLKDFTRRLLRKQPAKVERIKEPKRLRGRWLWISKAIPADVQTAIDLGQPGLIPLIMRRTKGSTYNVGSNKLKRSVDASFKNGKLRRRARTVMKRRVNEMVAGGVR